MAIASRPSEITLPADVGRWPTVLAYLIDKFPRIAAEIWQQRVLDGKVRWFAGETIDADTAFQPSRRLCYFREVAAEPKVPFAHQILFQNEHLLVVAKPHFLPVTPGGDFVNECLLERVRRDTGIADLAPLHRLDKETAGLVLFSCNTQSRPLYHQLFAEGTITKSYLAVAELGQRATDLAIGQQWQVKNRIEKSDPRFLMQIVEGEANANSTIQLLAIESTPQPPEGQQLGLFQLWPHTGKTHQLRLHMQALGLPILHDKYYPKLLAKQQDFQAQPLQLLAQQLEFVDPVCGSHRHFSSPQQLSCWPYPACEAPSETRKYDAF